jgi:uncharacterized protein (DUF4415 family)
MSKKSGNIVRYTAAELRAKRQRKGSGSDWKAAAKKGMPTGDDADDAMEEIDWATSELPKPRRKEHASLRLDADVLAWFRAQGPGYQTRINAVLRSYFEQRSR